MKPKAIDLFSGCGGLSLGLKQAGFNVVAALELDPLATETYKQNHKRVRVIQNDISKISARKLMKELGLKKGELELLAGCPPCQGFSRLRSKNGKRRIRQPQNNNLLFEFLRFARAFKPKTIMMENVPRLSTNQRIWKFRGALKRLGYVRSHQVLDAADFGVPQRRARMVLIASRIGPIDWAKKTSRRKTVGHVIGGLSHPRKARDPLHSHPANRTQKVMTIIRQVPRNGGSRSDLPRKTQLRCHKKINGFKDIYGRMSLHEVAPTITGGCVNPSKGRFLHPTQNRAITLREAALLQGFPRGYRFSLEKGVYPAAQMIGNAFPPPFARKQAEAIYEALTVPK
jgi:DNA (cytosine-5)-methyltransferase 1